MNFGEFSIGSRRGTGSVSERSSDPQDVVFVYCSRLQQATKVRGICPALERALRLDFEHADVRTGSSR